MNAKGLLDIIAGLVVVAGITTVVAHPASASIISAIGSSFSGAVKAAEG